MADPTPWLVVEQAPARGCPPGIYRQRCLRCGDVNDIVPPLTADEFLSRMAEFSKRHRKCKESPNAR